MSIPNACASGAPVYVLDIKESFQQLSLREKHYAHYMRQAAFHGSRIILRQVSPESEKIFDLVLELATAARGDWTALAEKTKVSRVSMTHFLEYASALLENLGNYQGYGDRKFVPRIELAELRKLCSASSAAASLLERVETSIYEGSPASLGYPTEGGLSNYYPDSPDLTREEIQAVHDAVRSRVSLRNTRLRKIHSDGKTEYQLLVASAYPTTPLSSISTPLQLADGSNVVIRYGDYADCLERMCESLTKAADFAASETQQAYLKKLIEHYQYGDLEMHKEASIIWLRDQNPAVEAWSGFLETGRDPSGERCEFEAFVTMEDKRWSAAFSQLADEAKEFILKLPWSGLGDKKDELGPFENDVFVKPNFIALNLLCYCVCNVWTGLTAPEYPEVKSKHGRKNLTFSNRAAAGASEQEIDFIPEQSLESFVKHRPLCFYLQLALHELIGHGCGKLFQETERGVFNFDREDILSNPFTGEPVSTWYNHGESPESAFGGIATAYSECLAEGIGLYLMSVNRVLEILAPEVDDDSEEVIYNAYLSVLCGGMRGLLSYNPANKKWGQVHDQARFGLLRCLLHAGEGFVSVQYQRGADAFVKIHMDRAKLVSIGRPALGRLLHQLHVSRCIKDVENGTQLLNQFTAVEGDALEWRQILEERKRPRALFLQCNTEIDGDEVRLKEYPTTHEGLIQSWVDREIPVDHRHL